MESRYVRGSAANGFALMIKGREDDRRLFERGVQLNVITLKEGVHFDAELLAQSVKLSDYDLMPGDLKELKSLFQFATTFGSLIQVPEELQKSCPG